MDRHPTVSVIIPTFNGEKWLDEVLSMLRQQTLPADETLVVDSGSTDATLEIIRRHNVDLLEINQEDFDHGSTRSLAARHTTGDILVYLTQDAIPASDNALELLVQPLLDYDQNINRTIAVTYGRQLPAKDADLFSTHLREFNYPAQNQTRCYQDRFEYGFKTIFCSNSFAAWQRETLAAQGFFPEKLLFGEDTLTVAKLLKNGYCVGYVSGACVYHSHNHTILQDFRRYFDIGVFHVDQAGHLEQFGGVGGAGKKYVQSELAMLMAAGKYFLMPVSFLRNLAKFIGYKLGKHYKSIPHKLAKKLSMNQTWWIKN